MPKRAGNAKVTIQGISKASQGFTLRKAVVLSQARPACMKLGLIIASGGREIKASRQTYSSLSRF